MKYIYNYESEAMATIGFFVLDHERHDVGHVFEPALITFDAMQMEGQGIHQVYDFNLEPKLLAMSVLGRDRPVDQAKLFVQFYQQNGTFHGFKLEMLLDNHH